MRALANSLAVERPAILVPDLVFAITGPMLSRAVLTECLGQYGKIFASRPTKDGVGLTLIKSSRDNARALGLEDEATTGCFTIINKTYKVEIVEEQFCCQLCHKNRYKIPGIEDGPLCLNCSDQGRPGTSQPAHYNLAVSAGRPAPPPTARRHTSPEPRSQRRRGRRNHPYHSRREQRPGTRPERRPRSKPHYSGCCHQHSRCEHYCQ